ncbi:hypothetical protein [Falsibacillus pallidus]|uniref:Uncharacterized protein n=1 Tax=Falsibacillus pallidus TaxID=493781 RepID=A0A370GKI2_9BACI|nr:hypothetical protein [Falsibacillus pallidus]RDI44268.1 hypothetical protein DFR59_103339 [Falsibacillus pallidus]
MRKRDPKEEMNYNEEGLNEVSSQIMNVYSEGTFDKEAAEQEEIETTE